MPDEKQQPPGTKQASQGENYLAPAHPSQSYDLSRNASANWRSSQTVSLPSLSHLNLNSYYQPGAQLSPDRSILTILSAPLSADPAALEAFISEQINLPPRPTIRIRANLPNQPIALFDLQFDLLRHISPDAARHARWTHTKVHGMSDEQEPIRLDEKQALFSGRPDPTGAAFWIRRFCASAKAPKRFIMRRSVINWDTQYLEESIQTFIKSTGYRGPPIYISFPIHYQTIIVQSPHKVNGVLTGLQSLFVTPKTYEPLTVVWPYASAVRNSGVESEPREVMFQDEDDWLVEWREVIQVAIVNRRVGWLGESDKIDAAIEGPAILARMKKKIEL